MVSNEPMNDERLAEIRQLRLGVTDWPWTMYDMDSIWGTEGWVAEASSEGNGQFITQAPALVDDLLAEMERLRAENAAMRPIVEAVANHADNSYGVCLVCGFDSDDHGPGCPAEQAQTFVAAHPTPPA